MASTLNEIGFSKESVNRNPAMDLGGVIFFVNDLVSIDGNFFHSFGQEYCAHGRSMCIA
jgi:hypothetical protein